LIPRLVVREVGPVEVKLRLGVSARDHRAGQLAAARLETDGAAKAEPFVQFASIRHSAFLPEPRAKLKRRRGIKISLALRPLYYYTNTPCGRRSRFTFRPSPASPSIDRSSSRSAPRSSEASWSQANFSRRSGKSPTSWPLIR